MPPLSLCPGGSRDRQRAAPAEFGGCTTPGVVSAGRWPCRAGLGGLLLPGRAKAAPRASPKCRGWG